MITGRFPFNGEHDASIFYSIINQTPEPLARYKADISEGLQRIIDKALDKEPETRYQHFDEVLSDLIRIGRNNQQVRRRNRRILKRISFIIVGALIIIMILLTANYFLKSLKTFRPPKHTQLTFDGNIYLLGNESELFDLSQISPDGQFIAYVKINGIEKCIYVRETFGEKAVEVFRGLKSIVNLKWSPRGNKLLFTGLLKTDSWSDFVISKFGSKIQQMGFHQHECWSHDENMIAGVKLYDSKEIEFIKCETGEVTRKINLQGQFNWIYDIDWSPKGDILVFLTIEEKTRKYVIWTIKIDGSKQQKIWEETRELYSPRWSPDGNYIYFLREEDETQELIKLEVSSNFSNDRHKVILTGLQAYGFSITRDNKKLCYTKYNNYSNLWSFTYDQKSNQYLTKKLTSGTSSFYTPKISSNCKEICFIHNGNVFKSDINGESIKQLTFFSAESYSPTWSPNSEKIAFVLKSKLYKISSEGGIPEILTDSVSVTGVYWLKNSEIFYQRFGDRNIYIYNLLTKEKKLLISNDSMGWIFNPCLSPNGFNISVFWNRSPTKTSKGLWIFSSDSLQKLVMAGNIIPLRWSEDSKWIYALNFNQSPYEVLMISPTNGNSKVILILPQDKIINAEAVDITPNRKTIVAAIQETNSDMWMIENFDPDIE